MLVHRKNNAIISEDLKEYQQRNRDIKTCGPHTDDGRKEARGRVDNKISQKRSDDQRMTFLAPVAHRSVDVWSVARHDRCKRALP